MSIPVQSGGQPLPPLPLPRRPGPDRDATGRKNMQQLIQLRWIAVLGQLGTILITHFGFDIQLPLMAMLAVLLGQVIFNGTSLLRLRLARDVSNGELLLALLVDVATLTMQLYLSGGATNPFVFLYLMQVVLSAVLLEIWSAWIILITTAFCFVWLAYAGRPLTLPLDHHYGLWSLYLQGLVVCFVLNATLLIVFINRITRNRSARDSRLAELRQRAAEEEHIVRMGLLATGAAHELGTPLSTLAVILGDWRHIEAFRSDPDLLQEISEMQTQVLRCKTIVTGILQSAGETRGESPEATSVCEFLDELVEEWRNTRPVQAFGYQNNFGQDVAIVSDSALKQTLCNVLDNALEASPGWVGMEVERHEDTLELSVMDNGPGFAEGMLEHLGRPYQSSKGRQGGGLGLFLVMNVMRTLGGNVTARNRPEGGAVVTLTLPLSALTVEEESHDNG